MDVLKTWGISLTAAAVVCMAVEILAPKTPLKKMLNLLISVFFLSAIFSPLLIKAGLGDLEFEYGKVMENSEFVKESTDELTDDLIVHYTQKALTEQLQVNFNNIGVFDTEIEIFININEDTGIFINSAVVNVPETYKTAKPEMEKIIENTVGSNYTLNFVKNPE